MKIKVPQSEQPLIRFIVSLKGKPVVCSTVERGAKEVELPLPEGVAEAAVKVDVEFLSNSQRVVHSMCMQVPAPEPAPVPKYKPRLHVPKPTAEERVSPSDSDWPTE
jgi:hypothetical protein